MSDQRPHDASYRKLFSHKPMIEDLLRQFARGPWLEQLDFDSLEPVPTQHVAEDLQQRQDDMIWRLRYRDSAAHAREAAATDGWFYVYILVEFQSSVDRFMALRLLVYVGLLYQHLVRLKDLTEDRRLPPILPIVLYNGDSPWTAPQQLGDLIANAEGLDRFQPSFEFLLLDEGRVPQQRLKSLESPVAAMFEIEQSRSPEDLARVVDKLCRVLAEEGLAEVRRDFATWLKRLVVPSRFAESELWEIQQLEEFRVMIEERVKEWTKQWEANGYQRGMAEGIEQGIEQGIERGIEKGITAGRQILRGQMELKFGPLPTAWQQRLDSATFERLEAWSRHILTADSLEQMVEAPD